LRKRAWIKKGLIAAVCLALLPATLGINQTAAEALVIPAAGAPSTGQSIGAAIPVLERFHTYTGQRTPEALTALFIQPTGSIVRQLPLIALSDGSSAVIIAARITATEGRALSFALEGATLLSSRKIKAGEWELKALPDKGAVTMALLVMNGGETSSYPLTVAPGLPPEIDLSSRGFADYLASSVDSGQAAMDLNNDGHRDYIDDYIYTANFLANQRTTGRDKGARQQRALKRTLNVVPAQKKPEFDPAAFPEPNK